MYRKIERTELTWEDRRDIAHRLHVRRERARRIRKAWEWVKFITTISVLALTWWVFSIIILSI